MDRATQLSGRLSRRRFVQAATGVGLSVAGLGLAAGCQNPMLPSLSPGRGSALETTRLRVPINTAGVCVAAQYIAEDLFRAEGFTDLQYIRTPGPLITNGLASGDLDIGLQFSGPLMIRVDSGSPIVVLSGAHVGCFELFGTDQVRAIRDLKGKTVAIQEQGGPEHVFFASMASYVGLNPSQDITWIALPAAEGKRLLAEGKVDAYLGFPPDPQELRASKVGHSVVNSAVDRPWSQYFCCMVAANQAFVEQNPVATKRALRAMLKAADICASEPERTAQFLVDRGYATQYDFALQLMKELPYDKWREYDPEDTVRFYALRLHEAGMVKSSPEAIIQKGTNWRFLNELKQELKA
jgi:NitT/TauT family transport system substrate-binding protein